MKHMGFRWLVVVELRSSLNAMAKALQKKTRTSLYKVQEERSSRCKEDSRNSNNRILSGPQSALPEYSSREVWPYQGLYDPHSVIRVLRLRECLQAENNQNQWGTHR